MANNCSKLMKDAIDKFISSKGVNNEISTTMASSIGLGGAISQSEANTMATEKDIAPKQRQIETDKVQKPILDSKFDFASIMDNAPEQVNPSNYKSSNSGIKDYIAKIESRGSLNPYTAKNPNSSAKGKYQFTDIMAEHLRKEIGVTKEDLKNPKIQEKAMDYLIGEYKEKLDTWKLPVTKENMFVLHNLGMEGGLRALRGTYTPGDIRNMAKNLMDNMDKSSRNSVLNNYATMYNVVIPTKRS